MKQPQCATCRHFWKREGNNSIGKCHRFPPPVHNNLSDPSWPVVTTLDGCGEHRTISRSLSSRILTFLVAYKTAMVLPKWLRDRSEV